MAAPEVHHLFHNPIADHSFSPDRSTLAVAKDNNVELYQRSGNSFTLQDELRGHDKLVTGVDIAPNSGKIVTCSQGISKPALILGLIAYTNIRSQCLRVGAFANGLEANTGASPDQPRRYLRPLVPI